MTAGFGVTEEGGLEMVRWSFRGWVVWGTKARDHFPYPTPSHRGSKARY